MIKRIAAARESCRRRRQARRGLAPLEFVLALPLLMMMMALMVTFGTAAAWKVRTLTAGRHGVWRARAGHNGAGDPHPELWPQTASLSRQSAADLTTARQIWQTYPLSSPVLRGPAVSGESPFNGARGEIALRDRRYMELQENVYQGRADITRRFAMMPRAGEFTFDVTHPLVDNHWQFHTMWYRNTGPNDVLGGGNQARRLKGWYTFEDNPAWAGEAARLQTADEAIQNNPNGGSLLPLDKDVELLEFNGRYSDFYPAFGGICSLDRNATQRQVDSLVSQIEGPTGGGSGGVPDRMASAWLRMYRAQLQIAESQLAALQAEMSPPVEEVARLRARIAELNRLIRQLENFQASLG